MADYIYPQDVGLNYNIASPLISGSNISFGISFSPKSISGLVVWLRSDLGITLNGSNVSSWTDQSGNGNTVSQGTASQQPAYTASSSVFGGKPCLRGDGVDDVLVSTNNVWPTSTITVFAVLASVSGGNTGEFFSNLQAGGNSALHFYGGTATEFKRQITGPGQTLTAATKSLLTYTVSGSGAGSSEKMYLNGGSTVTVSNAAVAISNRNLFIFGASTVPVFPRKYDLAELIIYNSVLSSTSQASVEQYLKGRYSIS